jgi:hypothetical protein
MKNLRNKLFTSIIALAIITISIDAKEIENFEVVILENSSVVKMEVNNPSTTVINISLFNAFEKMILSEKVDLGETYESQVDFSDLRRGTYTLVSEVGNMRLNKIFRVNNSQVELIDSYYSFKPVFLVEDDLLTVHYINNGNEDISLSIEDNLNVYYDEYYTTDDMIFSKVYSIENLESGIYNFKFMSNGELFTHEFEVD